MIRAESLSKRYWIYDRPYQRLVDWITPGTARRGREFWALRDVSFEIEPGTSLGVVGVNGAGKSTLLKLLTGTSIPTSGTFSVQGRVSALLELGLGFHPEFTGRENIALNGKFSGLGTGELESKTPWIIDFSELGDFIDQPLRTYSSGMQMRLAFAIAAAVEPEVLIIDEALSVGDLHFQHKCLQRIREFHEQGVTVLFVSHDPALVKSFCTEAILLDEGRLIDRGTPSDVLDYYTAMLAEKHKGEDSRVRILRPAAAAKADDDKQEARQETEPEAGEKSSATPATQTLDTPAGHRAGNFEAVITRVEIRAPGHGGNASIVTCGQTVAICVRAVAFEALPAPTIGIMIKDRLGSEIFGTNTAMRDRPIGPVEAGQAVEVEFRAPMNLGPGLYSVTAAIHQGDSHTETCYDWVEHAATFQILPSPTDRFTGAARLETEVSHQIEPAGAEELESVQALRRTLGD